MPHSDEEDELLIHRTFPTSETRETLIFDDDPV